MKGIKKISVSIFGGNNDFPPDIISGGLYLQGIAEFDQKFSNLLKKKGISSREYLIRRHYYAVGARD